MRKISFPFKPTFSGHETFPLRQLWLRKAYEQVADNLRFRQSDLLEVETAEDPVLMASKDVFSGSDALERFGVGKNMVASIKHWGLACDVIKESHKKDGYFIGEIGEFLFGDDAHDPFLEHEASLWLIHWLLASRGSRSATWYVLFNFIDPQTFQTRDLANLIQDYAERSQAIRSKTTIQRDIEVCLKCYTSVPARNTTEDSAEPLLTDLNLILPAGSNLYQFNRGPQYSLSAQVFVFALMDFWERWENQVGSTQSTLSFNTIAYEFGSPGRVFKLSEDALADRLAALSDDTRGYLAWTDSAGLRQVSKLGKDELSNKKMTMLVQAYD
jgi:hypothetical protein